MNVAPHDVQRVAVVTGTRAEFGLLKPVMRAIDAHPGLELCVVAAGAHLLGPDATVREVEAEFSIAARAPMQEAGVVGRFADARAAGRGIVEFTRAWETLSPNWVVVLGDRIEAFAAGASASIAGVPVAHIHGGDRAEGVADEAMRHAITKLAHLHLAATEESAARIRHMGEPPETVVVVGSPAIDGLDAIDPLDDARFDALGQPQAVLLFHPIGRTDDEEALACEAALEALRDRRVLAMAPNFDPGRDGIARTIAAARSDRVRVASHLRREEFVGLLKRLAGAQGVLVGNSSAGLIEAAAVGCAAVDIGNRQGGRERHINVRHAGEDADSIRDAVRSALVQVQTTLNHPYGDGRAGERIAAAIAECGSRRPIETLVRKRCVY